MLRSIFVRNQVLNDGFKKSIRSNIKRCMSTELSKRKLSHKVICGQSRRILAKPQWTMQMRQYANLPGHTKVNLPALSPTMETGNIGTWHKKEGDKLYEGDLLCDIETDKATMGFDTPDEGFLAKILIPSGSKGVPVGKLLCIIVREQADVAPFKDYTDDAAAPAAAAAAVPAAAPAAYAAAPPAAAAAPSGARVYASPMARKLAEIRNIRLGGKGSGLYGSLKSGDLSAAMSGASPAAATDRAAQFKAAARARVAAAAARAPYVDIPLSGMRATIAKRLSVAKQTIPHYQLTATVNVEKTMAMRKAVNERLAAEKAGVKLSMNDFIVKAVAAACKRVPAVNAHWMETFIRQFNNVHVSVAVATPSGLITPILFNSDSRGIIDLSKNMKELAKRAREGKLRPQEYQGGTVTVSNLGMYVSDWPSS